MRSLALSLVLLSSSFLAGCQSNSPLQPKAAKVSKPRSIQRPGSLIEIEPIETTNSRKADSYIPSFRPADFFPDIEKPLDSDPNKTISQVAPDPAPRVTVSKAPDKSVVSVFNYANPPSLPVITYRGHEFVCFPTAKYQVGGLHGFGPRRILRVKAFAISVHEISLGQYRKFRAEVKNSPFNSPQAYSIDLNSISEIKFEDRKAGLEVVDVLPKSVVETMAVTNITPWSAEAYCFWLRGRLPYSVEWEIAARTMHSESELLKALRIPTQEQREKVWRDTVDQLKAGLIPQTLNTQSASPGKIHNLLDGVSEMCNQRLSGPGQRHVLAVRGGAWYHNFAPPLFEAMNSNTPLGKLEFVHTNEAKPYVGFRVVLNTNSWFYANRKLNGTD